MNKDFKDNVQELGPALSRGAIGTAAAIAAITHPEFALTLAGTPFLTEAMSFFPNRKAQKIELLLNSLASKVGALECHQKFWQTFESTKISDLLRYVIEKAANADTEEKIETFSKILYNGISSADVNTAIIKKVIDYVSSLDEIQLAIIHEARCRVGIKVPHEEWQSVIANIVKDSHFSIDSQNSLGYNIYMFPLIIDANRIDAQYSNRFFIRDTHGFIKVTALGEIVLAYIGT